MSDDNDQPKSVPADQVEALEWSAAENIARRWIDELGDQFSQDDNPLRVWKAIDLACRYGIPLPEWVLTYLAAVAAGLLDAVEQVGAGYPPKDLAKHIQQTLGFSGSRGQRSAFAEMAAEERDEQMFSQLRKIVDPVFDLKKDRFVSPTKLDLAYDIVAEAWAVDRSTVSRVASSFLRQHQIEDESGRRLLTMEEFVRFVLDCKNKGREEFKAAWLAKYGVPYPKREGTK